MHYVKHADPTCRPHGGGAIASANSASSVGLLTMTSVPARKCSISACGASRQRSPDSSTFVPMTARTLFALCACGFYLRTDLFHGHRRDGCGGHAIRNRQQRVGRLHASQCVVDQPRQRLRRQQPGIARAVRDCIGQLDLNRCYGKASSRTSRANRWSALQAAAGVKCVPHMITGCRMTRQFTYDHVHLRPCTRLLNPRTRRHFFADGIPVRALLPEWGARFDMQDGRLRDHPAAGSIARATRARVRSINAPNGTRSSCGPGEGCNAWSKSRSSGAFSNAATRTAGSRAFIAQTAATAPCSRFHARRGISARAATRSASSPTEIGLRRTSSRRCRTGSTSSPCRVCCGRFSRAGAHCSESCAISSSDY